MKVLGVIVEYNPFHNGHLYHLNMAKELISPDVTIAVMSGNYIQRGEPAIINKWARTKMALLNGVDIVFELPFVYACNSAEIFAYGAVKILSSLGVNHLVFGTEEGHLDNLYRIAELLAYEDSFFKNKLKDFLKQGNSYPKARQLTIQSLFNYNIDYSPNNILAIEYLKWIIRLKSRIRPSTIKRISSSYNSENIELDTNIASATAIRKNIDKLDIIKILMPEPSYEILMEEFHQKRGPVTMDDVFRYLIYNYIIHGKNYMDGVVDLNEGLENRFEKFIFKSANVDQLIKNVKSKRYTYTRLNRIIIHSLIHNKLSSKILLEINPYVRLLGFNKKGQLYLNKIKKDIDIITKIDKNLLNKYDNLINMEIKASTFYYLLYKDIKPEYFELEYKQKPIFIP